MKEISTHLGRNEQITVLMLIVYVIVHTLICVGFVEYTLLHRTMPLFIASMRVLSALFVGGLFVAQFLCRERALTWSGFLTATMFLFVLEAVKWLFALTIEVNE